MKYEFGTVQADNGKEASAFIVNPFIPKESQVLVLVSQNVGTPVFPNLEHQEIIERISNLETAIIWKESDFKFHAKKLEATEGKTLFDRKKFIPALYGMIKNHNPVEGISISTIEKYLHTFAKWIVESKTTNFAWFSPAEFLKKINFFHVCPEQYKIPIHCQSYSQNQTCFSTIKS